MPSRGGDDGEILRQAIALIQSGNLPAARSFLQDHDVSSKAGPETVRLLAKLHNALGDKLAGAEVMARLLDAHPTLPEGWYELGVMRLECRQWDQAANAFQAALHVNPGHAAAAFNLAWALAAANRLDEAVAAYEELAVREQENPGVHFNLANLLSRQGKLDLAVRHYRHALGLAPGQVDVLVNLGVTLQAQGRFDDAREALTEALVLAPRRADVREALGNVLARLGDGAGAVEMLAQAYALAPDNGSIACNYALALANEDQGDQALSVLGEVVKAGGEPAGRALGLMGMVHLRAKNFVVAQEILLKALAVVGEDAEVLNNLGKVYSALGPNCEVLSHFRRAHAAAPTNAAIHSNLLQALLHSGTLSPSDLFEEHLEFGRIQEELAGPVTPFPAPVPRRGRRLRLGYVSPDFRDHAVTILVEPLLSRHDRAVFEVFCYACKAGEDQTTRRIMGRVDHWRDISALPASVAAAMIRQDGIDILVDLAGHTAHNALPVFARKPAPIQITWLGYPGTTGLSRMDYRFGLGGPVPAPHPLCSEQVFNTCDVAPFREPAIGVQQVPPPMSRRGYVTFGAVNKKMKMSDEALWAWSRVLHRVSGSRLVMVVDDAEQPAVRQALLDDFARHGVSEDSVTLEPRRSLNGFLELLNDVDICLDPFPYGGGTTTLFTSWMGVPTVTLSGAEQCQGTSAELLRRIGGQEWVADSVDGYVDVACRLAEDPAGLSRIRAELRARMLLSPMMDGITLTRSFEVGLLRVWDMYEKGAACSASITA